MIEKLLNQFKTVSMKNGRFFADKSYKYDTIFFGSKYIYEIVDSDGKIDVSGAKLKVLTDKFVEDLSLKKDKKSEESNRNYILETLGLLEYSGVISKISTGVYQLNNLEILEYITVCLENAYIFQYLLAYQTYVNDGLWNMYKDYCNENDKAKKKEKLDKLGSEIMKLSVSVKKEGSVWAYNVVKYSIMVLGLGNKNNKVSRTLNILDDVISPVDLANDEGTKTTTVKKNFFIHEFRLSYVVDTLNDYLVISNKGGAAGNKYSSEWFKEKGKEFADIDVEAKDLYDSFKAKFAPNIIKDLKDEELINSLFLGGNSDNMCHELEYVTRNKELFGSVKSGTAFKYPLFKRGEKWMSGTSHNPIELSLSEAIIKGTQVRDALVNGAQIVSDSLPLNTVEDYLSLYTKLYAVMPEIVDSLWVIKYFHMIFNDAFPVFYNKDWQLKVLSVLKTEANDTAYGRLAQINIFVNECEITNVVFAQVFHKYCRNVEIEEEEEEIEEPVVTRLTGGENIILYGVPGAGKSWTIKKQYCSDDTCIERLVFHPDYTYSDFVGQILPKISEDGSVSYVFTAGPFTSLVKKAYQNPDKMYYLVIEEVNRGNAPAIFGDVFQLLDRKEDGSSEYEITNADIAKIVYGTENHKVSIPSNMSILCTMNTSDQNVFTLDTAFQRRWSMRLIKNVFHEDEEDEKKFASLKILDTDVTWNKFFTEINKIILNKNIRMTSSEDKRLGTHFVGPEDLKFVEGDEKQNSRFPEKVLKYLWDDAFKFTKEDIFDLEKVKSLEDVIEIFVSSKGNDRFKVFKENIYNTIVTKPAESKETA